MATSQYYIRPSNEVPLWVMETQVEAMNGFAAVIKSYPDVEDDGFNDDYEADCQAFAEKQGWCR